MRLSNLNFGADIAASQICPSCVSPSPIIQKVFQGLLSILAVRAIPWATDKPCPREPVEDKWKAFGWHVQKINGHNHQEVLDAVEETSKVSGKPHMIIAETTKGQGVKFMHGVSWHGKAPSDEQCKDAIQELEKTLEGFNE